MVTHHYLYIYYTIITPVLLTKTLIKHTTPRTYHRQFISLRTVRNKTDWEVCEALSTEPWASKLR